MKVWDVLQILYEGNMNKSDKKWTKEMDRCLQECWEAAKKNDCASNKRYLLEEWRKCHPKSKHSALALHARQVKLSGRQVCEQLQTAWTDDMLQDLLCCKEKALEKQASLAKNNIKVSYMAIMHEHWMELYPGSDVTVKNLLSRLHVATRGRKAYQNVKQKLGCRASTTQNKGLSVSSGLPIGTTCDVNVGCDIPSGNPVVTMGDEGIDVSPTVPLKNFATTTKRQTALTAFSGASATNFYR